MPAWINKSVTKGSRYAFALRRKARATSHLQIFARETAEPETTEDSPYTVAEDASKDSIPRLTQTSQSTQGSSVDRSES